MRIRVLALTLVPLIGMTTFAFLWTNARYSRASQADTELKTTQLVTELAALSDNLSIENSVGGLAASNPTAQAFTGGAHAEVTRLRAELGKHAADIDRLADRPGSWAKLAAQVDAIEKHSKTTASTGASAPLGQRVLSYGKSLNSSSDELLELARSAAKFGTTNNPAMRAVTTVHELIARIGYVSDDGDSTLATVMHSSGLQQDAYRELLVVFGLAGNGSFKGATGQITPLVEAQTSDVQMLDTLVTRKQADALNAVVDGPAANRWKALRGQIFAADKAGVPGPTIEQITFATFPWTTGLISYRTELGKELRDTAQDHVDSARRDARIAGVLAFFFALLTLGLAVALARSIRRSLLALDASESFSQAIVTTAPTAIWTVDRDRLITTSNPAADELLGGDSIGKQVEEVLGREVAASVGSDSGDALDNDEIWLRRPDGTRVPALVGTSRANDVWTIFARDIAELKEYETQLSHQAFHDELTGLPNRSLLLDRIEHALARRERDSDWGVALIMVDLDDFKSVNDALGHTAGDELLVSVAARLSTCLRPGDTAARLGGDEFAVLLEGTADASDAEAIAERLVEILQLPLRAGDRDLAVSASVGLKLADPDATPQTLLRDADIAMYAAKGGGKARARAFTTAMHEDATRKLELRNDLAHALEREELRLVYQPMIELAGRQIVGAEALLRWQHPDHGVIPPLDFIPLAEETGLIVPIGRWVLNEACRTAASWPSNGTALGVSVNVSGAQLAGDDIVDAVRVALDDSGLSPERLTVELTESVLIDDMATAMPALEGLKKLGVTIAIDDFGTGYSSLAYLRRFPLDHLKIDRAFIRDLTGATNDRSLARSIVDLAGVLGLSAVAEGVETAEQADLLTALACDFAQGYHFSRPIEPDELSDLIARGPVTSEIAG